jgi:hypothetical protein
MLFSDVILSFSKFILKIQADCTFLPDPYEEHILTDKRLKDLTENEFGHQLRIALTERMHNTPDGILMWLNQICDRTP